MTENTQAPEKAIDLARRKMQSIIEIYSPYGAGREGAIAAMSVGLVEFEAAVREDAIEARFFDLAAFEQTVREDQSRIEASKRPAVEAPPPSAIDAPTPGDSVVMQPGVERDPETLPTEPVSATPSFEGQEPVVLAVERDINYKAPPIEVPAAVPVPKASRSKK